MRILIFVLLLCTCRITFASGVENMKTDVDTLKPRLGITDDIPESYLQRLDELYSKWYVDKQDSVFYVDSAYILSAERLYCSDSVYLARLDSINSAIPFSYNDIVRNCIELYTVRKRAQVATMLGLSEYYFPMFEEALAANDMPMELKYLPVIESALNPRARSHAGASGLWQFIYSTGRIYKLEVNSFIDERNDPYRSTQAAVTYLKDLYGIYGDWMLVIAAYNCGPGNVNKAIRRSGGTRNYWDIYYKLPKETRTYVPLFIAANYVFNYSKEHNIYPICSTLPVMSDSIVVDEALHFDQICEKMDLSPEQLRDLNPQYKMDVIPAGFGKTYVLNMPYSHVGEFIDNQDSIFAYKREAYFNDKDRTANPSDRIKQHAYVANDKTQLSYTVKNGDVLGAIATRFNVKLADLKYWNKINKNIIHPGQKLTIFVPENRASQYASKAKVEGKVSNDVDAPKVATVNGEYVYYTVRNGENLWSIAKKYPGVTNRDLMKWNGISDGEVKNIKPGMKLKIKI